MYSEQEKRRQPRIRYSWPLWFGYEENGELTPAQVVDLSPHGVSFNCDQNRCPQPGHHILTRFSFPCEAAEDACKQLKPAPVEDPNDGDGSGAEPDGDDPTDGNDSEGTADGNLADGDATGDENEGDDPSGLKADDEDSCSSTGGSSSVLWLVLMLLVLHRRRGLASTLFCQIE